MSRVFAPVALGHHPVGRLACSTAVTPGCKLAPGAPMRVVQAGRCPVADHLGRTEPRTLLCSVLYFRMVEVTTCMQSLAEVSDMVSGLAGNISRVHLSMRDRSAGLQSFVRASVRLSVPSTVPA